MRTPQRLRHRRCGDVPTSFVTREMTSGRETLRHCDGRLRGSSAGRLTIEARAA